MTHRNIIFIGAALVAAGVFAPIVSLPMIGPVNIFGNGGNAAGLVLLALALLSAGVAAKELTTAAFWPGVAAGGVVIYCFARLQFGMAQMRASLKELEGNPFAGLVEGAIGSVQIQWGWLVLAAGVAMIVYGGFKSASSRSVLFSVPSGLTRVAAAAAVVALLAVPALDAFNGAWRSAGASAAPGVAAAAEPGAMAVATGPSREETTYIAQNLQVYALEAKYFDSMLDGRVPGVTFKVKNNGARTLHKVVVRVAFQDAEGRSIAEEEYMLVLVSEYSFGDANTPLRPNYIAQQERGSFYTAKSVPSEWATGRATATITDIEFAPDESASPPA